MKVETTRGERMIPFIAGTIEDNDGFRVDTEAASMQAWCNVLMEEFGVDFESVQDETRGRTGAILKQLIFQTIREQKGSHTEARAKANWAAMNADRRARYIAAIQTSEGVCALSDYEGFMKRRMAAHLPSVMVTNSSQASFEAVRARFPWLYEADSAHCTKTQFPPKPEPHMLFEAIRKMHRQPGEFVMFGDSASDADAALAAGIPAVLRTTALEQLDASKHHHPQLHFIESLDAVSFV